jgi:hypothetical protein
MSGEFCFAFNIKHYPIGLPSPSQVKEGTKKQRPALLQAFALMR